MRKLLRYTAILFLLLFIAIGIHIWYLTTLSAKEKYPEDQYLLSAPNKKALIIVAHDDDIVGTTGTLTMLTRNGWQIREMCFYQQGGRYNEKDSIKNPKRKLALQKAAAIQGLAGIDPVDFNFRNDMNTEQSYMPMPYANFPVNFKTDSLLKIIGAYINQYQPAVIFTLDDVMGGYGHPDHTMMSQLVRQYCELHKNDPGFSVKRIYQPVFPPSLAENIMKDMPVYQQAKKVYNCNGAPLPDVQITVTDYASEKKQAMAAYTTEQNSIKKIWPYYNWYPAKIYFRIFDRDFFRIIDLTR